MNERLSDPAQGVLGRFISRDPIGFAGSSLNLYAYPTNPVNLMDPSGLSPMVWFIKTARGKWKRLGVGRRGKQRAAKEMRQPPGVNLRIEGCSKNARESQAVDLGEKVFGKDNVVVHRAHDNPLSIGDHVQAKNRKKAPTHIGWNFGHIYFSGGMTIPFLTLGTDTFGDNLLGQTVDAFNPMGDVEFIVGISQVLNPINFGAQFRPKIVHVPFND